MRLFVWFRKYRVTINSILITIFTSLIFNSISDTNGDFFDDPSSIIKQVFNFQSLGGLMTLSSLVLLLLFNCVFKILHIQMKKKTLTNDFHDLMKSYTSPQLSDSIGNGCLSWGEGKTVQICNDIIFGWDPQKVIIDGYTDELYNFYAEDDQVKKYANKSYYFNESDYLSFINTDSFRESVRKGNNSPRFMLRGCSKNYNRENNLLLINLGRTEWSQTSYVWNRFGRNNGNEVNSLPLMKEYAKGITSGNESEPYLPNSFCLHLLIETIDNKVILSRISRIKLYDNPGTWAATLGEQIDLSDFTDGNNYYDSFVLRWLRRAFQTEYRFDDNMYEDIVDESSLRIISLDFESDRYNFALFCTVQLRYTFNVFYNKIAPTLSTEQAIELMPLSLEEIPDILIGYKNEKERIKYHPSTYLRLLMYLMHKYGYSKAENIITERIQSV